MKRRSNFYGDSGTTFSEETKNEIDDGAGHSEPTRQDTQPDHVYQQQIDPDEFTHQAEMTIRDWEQSTGQSLSPEKRAQFVEGYAEQLRNPHAPTGPARKPLQEPREAPFLSRTADDKFWNSDEPRKQIPRRL